MCYIEKAYIKNKKKVPYYFIFCVWLALWTVLYKLNITEISPYFLNLGALLFSILFLLSKKNLDYKFIILNIYLHIILVIYIEQTFTYKNIKYNLLVFCIYLYFLYLNNTNMLKIYLTLFNGLNKFKHNKFSLKKYIRYIFHYIIFY